MIRIEVNEADCAVESRSVTTRNGPQTFYHQTAYLHTGGAYPDRFRIPVQGVNSGYPPGVYTLSDASFRVGRYGDLEINRFDFQLERLPSVASERKAS